MAYSVKEIFYTLQGEGAHAGRAAVFCRFAGCNLWSGREEDRSTAICRFCDTDFVGIDGDGGAKFGTADELADAISLKWPGRRMPGVHPYVVCTGGEPLLQLDASLVDALHTRGFAVGVETNGTIAAPPGVDWLCVSPKSSARLRVTSGDELKLVYPQPDAMPDAFSHLAFKHFFLQPMDGTSLEQNSRAAVAYCKSHPRWRLSVQLHKVVGIP